MFCIVYVSELGHSVIYWTPVSNISLNYALSLFSTVLGRQFLRDPCSRLKRKHPKPTPSAVCTSHANVPYCRKNTPPPGSPLWPLRYLKPTIINQQGVGHFGTKFGEEDWYKPNINNTIWERQGLSYAKEIMSIASAVWAQCMNVTDRQTDGNIDRNRRNQLVSHVAQ